MMKPEFHDDYLNPEASPLDPQIADFDWTSLYDALGETTAELSEQDYTALGTAFTNLLKFVTKGEEYSDRYHEIVATRLIGLVWVLSPSYFEGNPSLTKLARAIGMNAPDFSQYTASVTKTFGLLNNAQAHGWNRK